MPYNNPCIACFELYSRQYIEGVPSSLGLQLVITSVTPASLLLGYNFKHEISVIYKFLSAFNIFFSDVNLTYSWLVSFSICGYDISLFFTYL